MSTCTCPRCAGGKGCPCCERATSHAQPVEGPMGDPQAGGSPPAGAEPVDQKASTVPAPPPTVDMEDEG